MSAPKPARLRRMAKARKIVLSVDADGIITVDPYYARFRVGDPIRWEMKENSPWTIGFHDKRTPTDALVIHGHGNTMFEVHKAQKAGHYRYTPALYRESHPKLRERPGIFLDASCPEIIVD